ncbi:MAG: PQQ-binding-like beta-propeller repeat protein [Hyphomonas sp.]|nr:PQQ-binding-like beta-propeller repeat protein [Hyphomonas sp.]
MSSKRYRNALIVATILGALASCTEADTSQEENEIKTNSGDETAASVEFNDTYAEGLYQDHCAICHNGTIPEAPTRETLERMTSPNLIAAMTDGVMAPQSVRLSSFDKEILATYLGGAADDAARRAIDMPRCEGDLSFSREAAWNRWGGDLRNSRFRTADMTEITADNVDRLSLKWAFGFPNAVRARSQPAVTQEAIFTGSQDGTVYALDTEKGCVWWTYYAEAEVRVAPSIKPDAQGLPGSLLFTDFNANVYSIDAETGAEIWKTSLKDHPVTTLTGSPTLHADRLFVPMSSTEVVSAFNPEYECCTFRGGVVALDAKTGERYWTFHTVAEPQPTRINAAGTQMHGPSGAPVWSVPTVDEKRDLLYFGTGENYTAPANELSDAIIALSLETGELVWKNQTISGDTWNGACGSTNANCPEDRGPDFDFGAPPILTTLPNGKDIILAGQKSGMVYAMDPDNEGETLWSARAGMGGYNGGIHWGMASDGETLFVGIADTPGHHMTVGPPRHGVHAYDVETGTPIWSTIEEKLCDELNARCFPAASAPVTATNDLVFAGGLDATMRIYSAQSGDLLWSFDTMSELETVNSVPAFGGSIDSAGPVLIGDKLIINSGYDKFRLLPGNALLVFELEEE